MARIAELNEHMTGLAQHLRLGCALGVAWIACAATPAPGQQPKPAQPMVQPRTPLVLPLQTPVQRVPQASDAPDLQIPQALLNRMDDASSIDRCIPADYIKSARAVDDQTIHVELHGKRLYSVRFRDPCNGLMFDQSFYYYLSPGRLLCARVDSIVTRSGSRCPINKINRR